MGRAVVCAFHLMMGINAGAQSTRIHGISGLVKVPLLREKFKKPPHLLIENSSGPGAYTMALQQRQRRTKGILQGHSGPKHLCPAEWFQIYYLIQPLEGRIAPLP